MLEKLKDIYINKYKLLILITIAMLIFFGVVLTMHKVQTGEFISKDVSLKGGLLITVHSDKEINIGETEKALAEKLGVSVSIKRLQGIGTAGLGYSFIVEPISSQTVLDAISEVTGLQLAEGNYTVEEVSSGLGATFWQNTTKAIAVAFVLMGIVVFIYFRKPIPSFAIILSAIMDIAGTLTVMSLANIELSIGGVAALLMLVGYSVDTDILLSTRVLKRSEGTVAERVLSSLKTGMTMQFTAIAAMLVLWVVSPAETLKQIAMILIIGLFMDMPSTWIQNVGILRWYVERKQGGAHGQA
jgi:preprotein translocase subunit SecF